jgi:hypothetical protein
MLLNIFKKKKNTKITVGDVVAITRNFAAQYPFVSRSTILTVQKVENDTAVVIFMNKTGTDVSHENIPLKVLKKIG